MEDHCMHLLAYPAALCLSLLYPALSAQAQWVNRCEGPDGRITFTAGNCPPGAALGYQRAYAQNPGTRLPATSPSKPAKNLTRPTRQQDERPPSNSQRKEIPSAPGRAAKINAKAENNDSSPSPTRTGKKYLPVRPPAEVKEKS
jgi:hypothetical protein